MTTIRDLIKLRANSAKRHEPNTHIVRARTVGVDYDHSPKVADKEGFIWVIEHNIPGGYTQVFNAGVPNMVNLPVLLSTYPKDPYIYQARAIDWDNVKNLSWSAGGTNIPTTGTHGRSHEWRDWDPGFDVVNVYNRNLVSLRAFPSTGYTVYVDYCRYTFDRTVVHFQGITFDWSSYVNANPLDTTFILVYLDMQSNTIKAVGNTVATADIGSIHVQHYPTLPDYALPSCIIAHTAQTTTVESMVTDVRDLYVYEDSRVYEWLEDLQTDLYDVQADLYTIQGDLYDVSGGGLTFSQTIDKSIANTTDEDDLLSAGRGLKTIAANTLAVGDVIRLYLTGHLSTGTSQSLQLRLLFGGVELCEEGPFLLNSSMVQLKWWMDLYIIIREIGATGSVMSEGIFDYHGGSVTAIPNITETTIDTTVDNLIEVLADWSSADLYNDITCHIATIEHLSADNLASVGPSELGASETV